MELAFGTIAATVGALLLALACVRLVRRLRGHCLELPVMFVGALLPLIWIFAVALWMGK